MGAPPFPEGSNTPTVVRPVAEAALVACMPDCVLLRPVHFELRRRDPAGWRRRLAI